MLKTAQSLDQAITHDDDATRKAKRSAVACAALTGIILGALLLRLGFAFYLPRVVKFDEKTYLEIGRNLVTGQGFVRGAYPESRLTELRHPPFQPIVLGVLYLFTGDLEWASNLAYALFGSMLVLPLFWIARRIYGMRTAWLVTIVIAVFPALTISVLYWATMIEPLYLLLLYGGLASLLGGLEDYKFAKFTAAGMLLGLAYLTRPEGWLYFAAFFILALVSLAKHPGLHFAWRPLALFVLSFVLFAAPYVWYLHANTGSWALSGKAYAAWEIAETMTRNDPAAWAAWDRLTSDRWFNTPNSSGQKTLPPRDLTEQKSVVRSILTDPARFIDHVVTNFHALRTGFFHKHIFWYWLLPLVFLALFRKPWEWRRLRHEAFLTTIIGVLMMVFLPIGFLVRYFAPAFPVLLLWSAQGAVELGNWLQGTARLVLGRGTTRLRHVLGRLPAGVLVIFFVAMLPVTTRIELGNADFGGKEVGLWLKAHTPAGAKVIDRSGIATFYSGQRQMLSPNTDWIRFLKYAHSQGANYWVVDDAELTKLRPQLAFILENRRPELELLYSFRQPHLETFVYRFVPTESEPLG